MLDLNYQQTLSKMLLRTITIVVNVQPPHFLEQPFHQCQVQYKFSLMIKRQTLNTEEFFHFDSVKFVSLLLWKHLQICHVDINIINLFLFPKKKKIIIEKSVLLFCLKTLSNATHMQMYISYIYICTCYYIGQMELVVLGIQFLTLQPHRSKIQFCKHFFFANP